MGHHVVQRSLFAALAVCWAGLGVASFVTPGTPAGGTGVWLAGAMLAAGGAATIAASWRRFPVRVYMIAAGVFALARSAAFLSEGNWSPMFVWSIVLLVHVLVMTYVWAELAAADLTAGEVDELRALLGTDRDEPA